MKSILNLIATRLAALALIFALAACGNDGVSVTTKFANTQDIKEGTDIYLGDKVIGSVSDISKTEHGSVVKLSIDSDQAKQVHGKAAIVVNRLKDGAPLEFHNPPGAIGQGLQSGQSVEGLDSMLQLISWGVGSGISAGSDSIAAFTEYLQSDDFAQDKASVGVAIDQGLKSAQDGLKEAGKELEKTLKDIDLSEAELAAAVEELSEEVAPMVKELAQGGAELMKELEAFTQNLEQSSAENQQSGEQFLSSLTKALEALNQSLNDGLEEGMKESR